MANLEQQFDAKANSVANKASEKMNAVGASVDKMSNQLGHSLGNSLGHVSETTANYYRQGRDYVKENPMQGVAIAAATGLAVGSLLTLALSRKH